jgi:cell division protein FtsB
MAVAAPPRPPHPAGARTAPGARSGGRRPPASGARLPVEGRIRWDRVGRVALLGLLAVVLLLYVAPLRNWVAQSSAAEAQRRDLLALEREHDDLAARARALRREAALEREARRLGMVKRGERPYVIQASGRRTR